MRKTGKSFAKNLVCDKDGNPSLSDCISVILVLAFLGASAYLLAKGVTWQHYEAFGAFTVGPGSVVKLGSKWINNMSGRERP